MVSPGSLRDDRVDLLGGIRWQTDLINAASQELKERREFNDKQGTKDDRTLSKNTAQ